MLFIVPIGVLTYFWDQRNYRQSLALFGEYIERICRSSLDEEEKMAKIDEMFYQNGYTRVERSATRLVVEKKHFNIGILFIALGILTYFGVLIYLLYYRFFLKPRSLRVDLGDEVVLKENAGS